LAFVLLCAALAVEYAILSICGGAISGLPAIARGLGGFTVGALLWRAQPLFKLSSRTADLLGGIAIGGFVMSLLAKRPEILPLWFALIVLALSYDNGRLAASLRTKSCVWLGNISFSLYLLHYPVILATDKFFPVEIGQRTSLFATALRPTFILALSLVLSDLSYRLIETPGRRIPRLVWGERSKLSSIGGPSKLDHHLIAADIAHNGEANSIP
jgi:peptidoglycan/LPS O-acetylase OafA/YrhL